MTRENKIDKSRSEDCGDFKGGSGIASISPLFHQEEEKRKALVAGRVMYHTGVKKSRLVDYTSALIGW